jgi:hypothetical protein
MPDEAKLNENEDGNAFAGPYVPSPPSRPKLRAEPDARRVATHQKRGPPIGLACCDSVSMARLQHAFALACAPQGMQTFGDASAMSAFNPKADIRKREWHVR